jgi:hypothetical protein
METHTDCLLFYSGPSVVVSFFHHHRKGIQSIKKHNTMLGLFYLKKIVIQNFHHRIQNLN